MGMYEISTSVLAGLTVASLLVAAGMGTKQLLGKRPRPVPARSRRRRP